MGKTQNCCPLQAECGLFKGYQVPQTCEWEMGGTYWEPEIMLCTFIAQEMKVNATFLCHPEVMWACVVILCFWGKTLCKINVNHRVLPKNQSAAHDFTDMVKSLLGDVGTSHLFIFGGHPPPDSPEVEVTGSKPRSPPFPMGTWQPSSMMQ